MPLVSIHILEGRTPDKIEAMVKNVTDAVSKSLDAPKENVRVLVTEVPKTHWVIGGKSAKELGK